MMQYSVLMTVYAKEQPEHFRQSIASMLAQTIPPDDMVIVCDGPLTPPLDQVISDYTAQHSGVFQVVRLPENRGIGYANQAGIVVCRHELVAKMDADDIAEPTRCEKQLAMYEAHPEFAVVGAYLAEFEGNPEHVLCVRRVPLAHGEIVQYAKRRSPFNNQTVMYRKSAILAVGGFADTRRCEDYDLYLRLLHAGYKACNLPEVLVRFRLSRDAYVRRGNWDNFSAFVKVRWKAVRMGYASVWDILPPVLGQMLLSLLPPKLREMFYFTFLRR